ncbi:PAS domain S-box protein [uncultured Methanoregula sp.]|uniref:PAS domain S-box protein n=1 Tax=uncultured Methanoregula sp. TaxID=1005933 RepID=UPI002AAC2539|nr:PAS domain S-box protein [uncultured Methanoregula sp.]
MYHILCVDDERPLLDGSRIFLEKSGDFTVTTAISATEGLRLLEREKFDAIVSDYEMPVMNGIEFLVECRARFGSIPFILFTGKGREDVVIEALNSGADSYLQKEGKPKAMFAELAHRIRSAADRKRAEKALIISEEKYRNVFSAENDAVFLVDIATGSILETNNAASRMFGYSSEEFTQLKNIELSVEPEKTRQAMNEPGNWIPLRYQRKKNGTIFPVDISISRFILNDRAVLIAVYRDITERMHAEEALRESEARYKMISETTTDFVFSCTRHDGGAYSIDWMAGAVKGITGYSLTELRRKGCWGFLVYPDDTSVFDENVINVPDGATRTCKLRIRTKIGTIRWLEVHAANIPSRDSLRGSEIFGGCRDITVNKLAEDALVQSEKKFRLITETIDETFWMADADFGKIFYASPSFERMWGRSRESLYKNPRLLFEAVHPDDRERVIADLEIRKSGKPFDHEYRIILPDGNIRYIWDRGFPIQSKTGRISRYAGVAMDITERKAATETIRKYSENLERDVAERTASLSEVNQQLLNEISIRVDTEKQLNKSVGEKEVLLREVHHRVKNNLQIIISLLNLQSRYITDKTTLAAFRESQNRIRAMSLVHEKLYRSTDLVTLDLDNYIQFLGDNLFHFFGINNNDVLFTLDIRDISLNVDTAIPLGLIINELISNSLKHAFPDGKTGELSIVIRRQDHFLTILFKDTGVGIPDDFDWRETESLGLRLIISLVEQLNGTIELDRSSGTAFTIIVHEKE